MSDFADVERFAREHSACGGLTPSAMPRPGGGYLLTLACVCTASFDRWVSPEEARRPLPMPARAPQPAAPVPAEPEPRGADEREEPVAEGPAAREAPAAPEGSAPPGPRPGAGVRPTSAPLHRAPTTRVRPPQVPRARLRARASSRGWAVWLALFVIVGLGAAGALYVSGGPDAPGPEASAGAPAPRAADPLARTVRSLRGLHAVAASTTSVSVYASGVTAAKTEAERYLAASPPGLNRTRVREALDLHLLAVSAWRAKSLDHKEAWEAVGLDPSIDLCPPLRLVADFAVQPEHASRAQTRGAAVASKLPLLWECASERIAALEAALATR